MRHRRQAASRPGSVAKRLERAIKAWPGGGVRAFARELAQQTPPPRGSSYAMIHRYLRGSVTPSLEFLRAAAETLGVREEFLTTGDGEMTATAQEIRGVSADQLRPLEEELFEALPENLRWLQPAADQALRELVIRIADLTTDESRKLPPGLVGLVTRDVVEMLRLPATRWGFVDDVGSPRYTNYVLALVSALLVKLHSHERRDATGLNDTLRKRLQLLEEGELNSDTLTRSADEMRGAAWAKLQSHIPTLPPEQQAQLDEAEEALLIRAEAIAEQLKPLFDSVRQDVAQLPPDFVAEKVIPWARSISKAHFLAAVARPQPESEQKGAKPKKATKRTARTPRKK